MTSRTSVVQLKRLKSTTTNNMSETPRGSVLVSSGRPGAINLNASPRTMASPRTGSTPAMSPRSALIATGTLLLQPMNPPPPSAQTGQLAIREISEEERRTYDEIRNFLISPEPNDDLLMIPEDEYILEEEAEAVAKQYKKVLAERRAEGAAERISGRDDIASARPTMGGKRGSHHEVRRVAANPQAFIGEEAKQAFFRNFHNLDKIKQKHRPPSPRTMYLNKCQQLGLTPEPMGVIRKKDATKIDLRAYSMGDQYAQAVADSLAMLPSIIRLNLKGNRLSPTGAAAMLNQSNRAIKELDLSQNSIGYLGVQALKRFLGGAPHLQELNLEGNKLGDRAVQTLCDTLTSNQTLKKLNLSYNDISDVGASAIAEVVERTQVLEELLLYWNTIRGKGALKFAQALKSNNTLRVLDLSWNSFGSSNQSDAIRVLSEALSEHQKLQHLDLSHNHLSAQDCVLLGNGLTDNHVLMGLHMDGNETIINSQGFLLPDARVKDPSTAHVFSRILGQPKVKNEVNWTASGSCWICDRWRPVVFTWTPNVSGFGNGHVLLHLPIDEWEPQVMDKEGDSYSLCRMVPGGQLRYFFTADGTQKVALDQAQIPLMKPLKSTIMFGETSVAVNMSIMNYIQVLPRTETLETEAIPRPAYRPIEAPLAMRPKSPWSLAKSVFNEYVVDDHDLLWKCFTNDWQYSKIPRLVKNQEETMKIQNILWASYKHLKAMYKYYSALGSGQGVFAISWNSFTEMVTKCTIPDDSNCKLKDIDMVFIATNYADTKNIRNPDRALVRYQFLESIVRLALAKYHKGGQASSPSEAVDMLMKNNILPLAMQFRPHDSMCAEIQTEDVDNAFKKFFFVLQEVYKRYSGRYAKPGQKKVTSMDEFIQFVTDANLCDDEFSAREIGVAFNESMVTVVDELISDRPTEMSFVEFVHAIARIADMKAFDSSLVNKMGAQDIAGVTSAGMMNMAANANRRRSSASSWYPLHVKIHHVCEKLCGMLDPLVVDQLMGNAATAMNGGVPPSLSGKVSRGRDGSSAHLFQQKSIRSGDISPTSSAGVKTPSTVVRGMSKQFSKDAQIA